MPPTPLKLWQETFRFDLSQGSTQQDIAEFSLWFSSDTLEPGDAELPHLAAGGILAWQNNMNQEHWATNVAFVSVEATAYETDGTIKSQKEVAATGGWVGTDTGAALPWETSLATSLYSYPRGTFVPQARSKRGRYYMPPMAASQLDGSNSGFFLDSEIEAMLSECAAFLGDARKTDVGVTTGTLCVYSRKLGDTFPITEISMDAKFDSQRRRQNREAAGIVKVDFP